MVKLDRYIGSSVLLAILAVLGIILGLALLFAVIDEMRHDGTLARIIRQYHYQAPE